MYIKLIAFTILALYIGCHSLGNHDYIVIHDHMTVQYFNKEYFYNFQVMNTNYNRTTRTFTTIMDVKKDIKNLGVTIATYVFLSNRYMRFAPMDFDFNACKALQTNYFGIRDILSSLNITECPIKKGNYTIKNYVPDTEKLPPKVPYGKYRLKFTLYENNKTLYYITTWEGTIKPRNALAG